MPQAQWQEDLYDKGVGLARILRYSLGHGVGFCRTMYKRQNISPRSK